MVLIQYHWFRDCFFKIKVSQIYNRIFKTQIDMSKQEEKFKQEAELLKKSCKQEPKDVELIQDLLALQKTKTLMIRKRGLQSDIDNRLNQFIEELKNREKV
jgi:DNA sulfur modification protein DndC